MKVEESPYRVSLEESFKKESSLLGAAGLAAAIHVAPNIAMKYMKHSDRGRNIIADFMRRGFKHGLEGQKLSPGRERWIRLGLGPEATVEYELARAAGRVLRDPETIKKMPAEQRQSIIAVARRMGESIHPGLGEAFQKIPEGASPDVIIKTINKVKTQVPNRRAMEQLARSPEGRAVSERVEQLRQVDPKTLHDAPVINILDKAIKREKYHQGSVTDQLLFKKTVPEGHKPSLKETAMHAAPLAGLMAAVSPEVALQPILSKVRRYAATSPLGKRMISKNYAAGYAEKPVGKVREAATDFLVSPGVLDPYRAGRLSRTASTITPGVTDQHKAAIMEKVEKAQKQKVWGPGIRETAASAIPNINLPGLVGKIFTR